MTLALFDLPGRPERGKRVERTEWGVRWLRDSPALTSKRSTGDSRPGMWKSWPALS